MRRFQKNLQTFAENIRIFAANFQKICSKKPGTLNRYGGNTEDGSLQLYQTQLHLWRTLDAMHTSWHIPKQNIPNMSTKETIEIMN